MKAKVNIGTNKGNIVGVEFDKPFNEITAIEIFDIAFGKFGDGIRVHGWADVTKTKKRK